MYYHLYLQNSFAVNLKFVVRKRVPKMFSTFFFDFSGKNKRLLKTPAPKSKIKCQCVLGKEMPTSEFG